MSLVPLADVKAHLSITTADSGGRDAKLQLKIDAAEATVSQILGGAGALASTAVTETVRACGAIALSNTPIISITSVTGDIYGSFPTTNLRLNPDSGVIRPKAYTLPLREDYYTVVYQSGYATLPADIVEAVKLMTQSMWQTQRGNAPGPGSGGESTGPADAYARALRILGERGSLGNA